MGAPGKRHIAEFDPLTNELHSRFGDLCLDLAKRGHFPAAWCVEIGISTVTFRVWRNRYPEFREATDLAKTALQAELESCGLSGDVNPSIWGRMMMAHFPEDYTPRSETKTTTHDGDRNDLSNRTDEEIAGEIARHEEARAARAAARAELAAKRATQHASHNNNA